MYEFSNLKELITHEFFNHNAYYVMIKSFIKSVFNPLVLLVKILGKFLFLLLIPLIPNNKNFRNKYITEGYKQKLAKRDAVENNYVRVYKP